jgi:hypothetical protein
VAKLFPAPQPWLTTVSGSNRIFTAAGEEVVLRGANIMRAEWGGDIDWEVDKAIPRLAEWGANVVVRGFASDPVNDPEHVHTRPWGDRVTSEQYLGWLDREQRAAEKAGMYIVFSWRHHEIDGDIRDVRARKPDDEATQALAALAKRYRGRANVIYSLQVEPHDVGWSELVKLYEIMVKAIRGAADPHKPLILAPGTDWSRNTSWVVDPAARVTADSGVNIIYKSHPYESDVKLFDRDFLKAHKAGLPVFVGEFGLDPDVPMTQAEVDALLDVVNGAAPISWAAWVFDYDSSKGRILTDENSLEPTEYGKAVKDAL